MNDDYRRALDYLYGRLNYERVGMPRIPGEMRLGRVRRLLRQLGDPQDALRIVHVAGTKGKGSTSAMMAAGLTASGVSTGLFCSPHLHRLEERFAVDGVEATPDELVALVEAVRPVVADLDAHGPHHRHRGATFFELTTAIGLLHFARRGVGAVLLEVGLGGRLDSTNCVRPALAVVTTISIDHTRQLGHTLEAIAGEKAGIFKRGRPALSGVRGQAAREVIRATAARRGSPFRAIDDDFTYEYLPPIPPLQGPTPGRVAVRTWRTDWGTLELPLLGAHQAHNAAVALAGFDLLGEQGLSVGPGDARRGFAGLKWPARVEVLGRGPWVVVDGAHNVASAEALAETLAGGFPAGPRTLVFGTTRDKDLDGQLKALLPLFDRVVATRYVENPRAVPPSEVADAVGRLSSLPAEIADDPAAALAMARDRTVEAGLICVTGSLFLAAEVRALLRGSGSSTDR